MSARPAPRFARMSALLALAVLAPAVSAPLEARAAGSSTGRPAPARAAESYAGVSLDLVPGRVYKIADPAGAAPRTESWEFHVAVRQAAPGQPAPEPQSAVIRLYSGSQSLKTLLLGSEELAAARGVRFRADSAEVPSGARGAGELAEAYDLRHEFTEAASLRIDSVDYRLSVGRKGGKSRELHLGIPVRSYSQATRLEFPVKGNFLVLRGAASEGGHVAPSRGYSVDIAPLGPRLEPVKKDGESNKDYVGWGQDVLAPADGRVVYARNDVPDNPRPGAPDPKLMAGLPQPAWVPAGNCVVIDHGHSEYSLLAHMQKGSVRVKAGDHVKRGETLGSLGNSGNSSAPHLHYHLMADSTLAGSDCLPVTFDNVDGGPPRPGESAEAK